MADSGRTVFGGGSGGGSLGLPTPNFSAGWGPGFAFESNDGSQFSSELLWDTAYPIDSSPVATGVVVAEDNEWFSWDPELGPSETPVIKRAGFYYVEFGINTSDVLTDPWDCTLSGSNLIDRVSGGFDKGGTIGIVPHRANEPVGVRFNKKTNAALTTTYAYMSFVPLFE